MMNRTTTIKNILRPPKSDQTRRASFGDDEAVGRIVTSSCQGPVRRSHSALQWLVLAIAGL